MADEVTLGKSPNAEGIRDAVHVAVISVVAAHDLAPGERISLADTTLGGPVEKIGIVDPFRVKPVQRGDLFWLCLMPRSITSLRHQWSHPAFPQQGTDAKDADQQYSEIWLRAYAMRMNSYDAPNEAYSRLLDGLKSGELFSHGSDLHGFHDLDDAEDLRYHAERVLGIKIDWSRFSFSCSC